MQGRLPLTTKFVEFAGNVVSPDPRKSLFFKVTFYCVSTTRTLSSEHTVCDRVILKFENIHEIKTIIKVEKNVEET